jgi:hypothetical protein
MKKIDLLKKELSSLAGKKVEEVKAMRGGRVLVKFEDGHKLSFESLSANVEKPRPEVDTCLVVTNASEQIYDFHKNEWSSALSFQCILSGLENAEMAMERILGDENEIFGWTSDEVGIEEIEIVSVEGGRIKDWRWRT